MAMEDLDSKRLGSQAEEKAQILVVPVAHGEGAQVAKDPENLNNQPIPSLTTK